MFKIVKYLVYLAVILVVIGLIWFLPKYSYVQKNPGYCVNLTKHLYYCGTQTDLKEMFNTTKENKELIKDTLKEQFEKQQQNNN